MKVIGIDPGTQYTGFGVVQKQGTRLIHIESAVIKLKRSLELAQKLHLIQKALTETIKRHQPEALVLEQAFLGQNARSTMVLSHARGAVLLTAAMCNLPVFEYSALEIKSASTGYGRASKEQVFDMVCTLLNLSKSAIQSTDQTDALSAAICHLHAFDLQQKVDAGLMRQAMKTS